MDDIFSVPHDTPISQVGEYSIVDEKRGVSISTDKRLALATDPATANHPLAMTQHQAKKITQNRIRSAMAELAHGKIDQVNAWLERVGETDPARAIELFMELAQFSLPKLKSVAIDVTASDGSVKNMSIAQLEALIGGGPDESVVAEQ